MLFQVIIAVDVMQRRKGLASLNRNRFGPLEVGSMRRSQGMTPRGLVSIVFWWHAVDT